MHQKLVNIHPFIDGNGRTARLIMNLILIRHGYTIANISSERDQRAQYYAALEKFHDQGDASDFQRLIMKTVKKCLVSYLDLLEPDVAGGKGLYFLERVGPYLSGKI
jgi:Fic family protein